MKKFLKLACLLQIFFVYNAAYSAPTSELFPKFYTVDVEGTSRRVAYDSNHSLEQSHANINRIIMMVHGANRNRISYNRVLEAAEEEGVADTTLIFMPQFLEDEDIEPLSVPDDVLFWGGGWRQGHLSHSSNPPRFSSFEVADRIITDLLELNPAVKNIVITGHSAGGQYAQRFAAGGKLEQTLKPKDIKVRYVSSNPSTFVFFNNRRPTENSTENFAEPTAAQKEQCPEFNEYRYGLEDLNSYMSSTGVDQILEQYPGRDARYIQGEDDTDDKQLSQGCEANLQGSQRIERGIIFYNHIRDAFGGAIQAQHQQVIVPNIGHSSRTLTGACGVSFLFDIGACDITTPGNLTIKLVDQTAQLEWVDHAQGETGYQIYRSSSNDGQFESIAVLSPDENSYVDQDIDLAASYHYRIKVLAGSRASGFSNTVMLEKSDTPPTPDPEPDPDPDPTPDPTPKPSSGSVSPYSLSLFFAILLIFYSRRKQTKFST